MFDYGVVKVLIVSQITNVMERSVITTIALWSFAGDTLFETRPAYFCHGFTQTRGKCHPNIYMLNIIIIFPFDSTLWNSATEIVRKMERKCKRCVAGQILKTVSPKSTEIQWCALDSCAVDCDYTRFTTF
jgi:hypothetical protein